MNCYQLSLPLMPVDIEEIYRDQATIFNEDHINVFAAYTPWGIRELDSEYCTRIRDIQMGPEQARDRINNKLKTELYEASLVCCLYKESRIEGIYDRIQKELDRVGEDPEELRNEILCNPHLHPCIKENLIGNLDIILLEMKKEYDQSNYYN